MDWFLARFKEPSTWRGITILLTVCGIALSPEQQEAIGLAGAAIVGLIGAFTKDGPVVAKEELPPIDLQGKSESDGWFIRNMDVHRKLRGYAPPGHITGSRYDERTSGFENK